MQGWEFQGLVTPICVILMAVTGTRRGHQATEVFSLRSQGNEGFPGCPKLGGVSCVVRDPLEGGVILTNNTSLSRAGATACFARPGTPPLEGWGLGRLPYMY